MNDFKVSAQAMYLPISKNTDPLKENITWFNEAGAFKTGKKGKGGRRYLRCKIVYKQILS